MQFLGKEAVPILGWTEGVPVEERAIQQLRNVAGLPFVYKHVAVMPDVHWGMGATVGSVIPTVGAIIPAAVGVDIGCGMIAARTGIRAEDLPDNLFAIHTDIEAAVPHGRAGCKQDLLLVICEAGRPMTRKQLVKALREAKKPHGLGTVAKALADLTALGELVNPRDKRGYRLAEWPRRPRAPNLF